MHYNLQFDSLSLVSYIIPKVSYSILEISYKSLNVHTLSLKFYTLSLKFYMFPLKVLYMVLKVSYVLLKVPYIILKFSYINLKASYGIMFHTLFFLFFNVTVHLPSPPHVCIGYKIFPTKLRTVIVWLYNRHNCKFIA